MEAFYISTAVVALAEMGDKTQLLSFVLAARLRRKCTIALGVLAATAANHALAGYVGVWVAHFLDPQAQRWTVSLAFFAFAAWVLRPDELGERPALRGTGVFLTTLVAFFLVEMGDKTQLATVALGARYESVWAVTIGTTLGMMIANVPAVLVGGKLAARLRMDLVRRIAAGLFFLTALLALFGPAG